MSEGRPETDEDPRVRLAGERTLLAWIRTGLAMMAFGFVVARFGLFLQELAPLHPNATVRSGGLSLWFGTALTLLGVVANLLAARDHILFLRRLDRDQPYRPPNWSLGAAVAVVLAAGGTVLVIYLVVLRP